MGNHSTSVHGKKSSDKHARSSQAPPPGKRRTVHIILDTEPDDIVQEASEDSSPASDPPAYSTGRDCDEYANEGAPDR